MNHATPGDPGAPIPDTAGAAEEWDWRAPPRAYASTVVRPTAPFLVVLCVLLWPADGARACPCQAGDPTLTGTSWGSTRANRVRLGLEARWYTEGFGTRGLDRADVEDVRLEPSVAWSATEWLVVSLVAPVAYRSVTHANLGREEHVGLADPELRLRFTLVRDAGIRARNALGVSAGIDVPLMFDTTAADGTRVSAEGAIGSGSADPSLGLWYVHSEGEWTCLAVAGWRFPTPGFGGMRMGPALDVLLSLQWQPLRELAIRLGPDARLELAEVVGSQVMAHTGGFSARAGGDVVWAPTRALMLTVGVRVPFAQLLNGAHDLGPTVLASVIGDIQP